MGTWAGVGVSRYRRNQLVPVIAIVILSSFIGCSSSAPRFRSTERDKGKVIQDDEFRFVSKIRDEEAREDDKHVDLQQVKKQLTSKATSPTSYRNKTPDGLNRDKVLLDVVSYLGAPYEFGGSSRNGIDCSGFTSGVYSTAVNKPLPRSTKEQFQAGAEVSRGDLEFGDLVFFNTTGQGASHVGIYIEDDLFVHASVSYGVTISSLESSYYRNRFVGARRIVQ